MVLSRSAMHVTRVVVYLYVNPQLALVVLSLLTRDKCVSPSERRQVGHVDDAGPGEYQQSNAVSSAFEQST